MEITNLNIYNDMPFKFLKIEEYHNCCSKYEYLKGMGIETLDDLITAYHEGKFNNRKKINKSLKGEIELLDTYYNDADLVNEKLLSTYLNVSDFIHNEEGIHNLLETLGFNNVEANLIYNYAMNQFKNISYDKKFLITDILKEVGDSIILELDSFNAENTNFPVDEVKQNIKFKIFFYKEYVLRNKSEDNNYELDIVDLINEKNDLLKIANNVEARINELTKQINDLKSKRL